LSAIKKGRLEGGTDTLNLDTQSINSFECHNKEDKRKYKKGIKFTSKIRYSGTSSIITIPTKVMQELNIKEGDDVEVQIYK